MDNTETKLKGLDAALHKITYGFHIVTARMDAVGLETRDKDHIAAGTVSWAMQSSFEPPMITVAIRNDSGLRETIGRAGAFALTILGRNDKELITRFATESHPGAFQINGVDFEDGEATASPLIDAGIAHLECEVEQTVMPEGDHVLFIGRIVNAIVRDKTAQPLTEMETSIHYGGTE
ncbi:MAG: flavin reductase family protein [Phaeodactylibacter sp.]|nr:flavin reductase family protein [Phaeodactylibacter sp.]